MATTTAISYSGQNRDDVYGSRSNQPGSGNSSAQYDTTYCDLGDHPATAYAPVTGYVFTIPDLPGWSGSNSDITDCYVEFAPSSTAGSSNLKSKVKLIYNTPSGGTFPSSYTSGNTPLSMYDAATGVTAKTWGTDGGFTGSWAANTYHRGPNVSSHLKDAFTAGATAGSSQVTVVVYGVTTAGPNNGIRAYSYNNGSYRPRLVVEYNFTPQNATATPSTVNATATVRQPRAARTDTYSTAVGGCTLDFYRPTTTKPTDGFPTVVWVHGGRFVSGGTYPNSFDENYLPENLLDALLAAGYAVAAITYNLSTETAGFYNTGVTHPMAVKQVKTAVRWLQTNATSLDLDDERFVLSGHSAGATIAAMAALSIGDTTTYVVRQNNSPNGRMEVGGKGSDYAYEVNMNYRTYGTAGSGLNYFVTSGTEPVALKGLLLYACPIDLTGLQSYSSPYNQSAYNSYFGLVSGAGTGTGLNGESDVNDYILGTTGSIYDGHSHTPSIPIAHYRSGGDTTIVPDAVSATPLYNALNTAGVDVSKSEITSGSNPASSAMSSTGLTRFVVTGADHSDTVFSSDPDEVITWLELVASSSTPATATPSTVGATAAVQSVTVTIDTPVAVGAVGATAAVPAASVAADAVVVVGVVGATAAVPAVSVAVNSSATVTAGVVTATATVPAATVTVNADVAASTVAATAAVPAPAVSGGAVASPGVVTATAAVLAATVTVDIAAAPSTVSATADVPSVAVAVDGVAAPSTVAATAAVPSPNVVSGTFVVADVVAATAAVPAPIVTASRSATVVASVVAGTAAVPSATVSTQGSATAAPAAVTSTAAVPAVTVTASSSVTVAAAAVAATATVHAVTVAADGNTTVTAVAVTATVAVPTPTVLAGGAATATPAAVAAVAAVPAPTVITQRHALVAPAPVNATVTVGQVLAVVAVIAQRPRSTRVQRRVTIHKDYR